MYKNILIATDGSDLSANAVKLGVTLAKTLAARVTRSERVRTISLVRPQYG